MSGQSISDKGHWFSLRRRRMQLVIAAAVVLIGLLAATGTGLLTSFGSSNQAYSDLSPSHYAYEHVQRLHGEGILGNVECPSGKFCPADSTDRKTAAVWIIRTIMEDTPPYVSNSRFSDVNAGDWKAKYIEEFGKRGITSGCGDDENGGRKFCPDNNVLRKHMAIFIVRAFDLPPAPDAGFEDVRSGTYFDSINRLAGVGITAGCGDGTNFCPDRVITRAQAAIMLGRALEWRDGPLETETETETEPEPTVSVQAANDPVSSKLLVTADADQDIKGWFYAVIDSHNFSGTNFPASCRSILVRQSQVWLVSGAMLAPVNNDVKKAAIYLDTGYAGRVVCVKATNNGNKTGYSGRLLPGTPPVTEDTRPPLITVKHVPGDSPSLTASANESVTGWAHIGPLNSAACANNLFGRGTRLGSRVALDGRDNGKWYCFRAKDAANNWGFGSRQAPDDAIQDTRNPVITVSFQSSGPSLSARADETVSNWQYIGPYSTQCTRNSFTQGTQLGSNVALDGGDNGKWYCFRAKDAANNWGFGSKQVPADAVDTTKPVLSSAGGRVIRDVLHITLTSNEPVKWSLQHSSNKPSSCSKMSFSNAATDYTTTYGFQARSVANGLRYYCLRGVDSGGQTGYSKWYLVDQKKPIISLAVVENRLEASVEDDSPIHDILYRTFETKHVDCPKVDYSKHSRRFPTGGLDITSDLHDRWICVRAMDDDRNRNKGHAGQLLVFTPSEPEPTSQLQQARFTSPTGYENTRLVSTYYDRLPSSNDIADPIKSHIDDNFVFYVKKQSAPGEHLEFKLATPGKLSAAAVSRTKVQSFAVHSIDYIDVSQRSDCNSNLFDDSTKTSVNGIHMSDSFTRLRSEAAEHSGELPLFTSQYAQYICTKVTLKADDKSRGVSYLFKIFVTEDTVDVPTEAGRYEGASSRHVSDSYAPSVIPLPIGTFIINDVFSYGENRRRYFEHMASRFLLYVEQESTSANNDGVQLNLAVNLPGKFIVDDASDIQRFFMEKTTYFYTGDVNQCDEEVFKSDNPGVTIYRHQEDELGQQLRLGRRGQASQYLCVKVNIKAEIPNTGIGGAPDWLQHRIFSYQIKSSDVQVRSGDINQPSAETSNTVSQTETLETLALIRGEDRVLLAQAQLQVADTVINDTWESVALTEDASCDETAFEDTDAINQGSEVADPQTDTQYCFRAEDSEGATHYIAALVTDDSFSGLDAAGPGTGGPIRGVMLIVVAIASIVGIGLIVVIIIFVSQKRTPKFR